MLHNHAWVKRSIQNIRDQWIYNKVFIDMISGPYCAYLYQIYCQGMILLLEDDQNTSLFSNYFSIRLSYT